MEIRKLVLGAAFLCAAAFSPAPISKIHGNYKPLPEQSQAQVAQQQVHNGNIPVVGSVPVRVDEVGRTLNADGLPASYKSGDSAVAVGSSRLEKGAEIVTAASERVVTGEKTTKLAWWIGVVVLVLGFFGGRAIVKKVEKATPVPTFSKAFLKKIEKGEI